MKLDRRPPPKIGFFVTFLHVYQAVFGQVFDFLDLPNMALQGPLELTLFNNSANLLRKSVFLVNLIEFSFRN